MVRVAESDICEGNLKRELTLRILQYYYETDQMRCLDEYLQRLPGEELTMEERGIGPEIYDFQGKL